MKTKDKLDALKQKTMAELDTDLQAKKSELFNLRFRHASGQLENPLSINLVKKDIARVNTVIRARQLKA